MKSSFNSSLIPLSLWLQLLFFISCNDSYPPKPTGEPSAIAIWGEIINSNENTTSEIIIEEIPNLTHSLKRKRLTNKDIKSIILLDKENNEIPLTYHQGSFKSESIKLPPFPLTLKINIKGNSYLTQAQMPQKAEVSELRIDKIKVDDINFLNFHLKLKNKKQEAVIIDILSVDNKGKIIRHNLSDLKGDNLNNRYKELKEQPNMIFIEGKEESLQSFKIVAPINESEQTTLRIRTVSRPYFNLLYNLEVQKNEEFRSGVNPIGNIKNAYGGFGAIQEEKIKISDIGSKFF